MRITIIGSDQLDSYLAALFAKYTHHEISLLVRNTYPEINKNEINILDVETNKVFQADRLNIYNDIEGIAPSEIIILASRASQNSSLINYLPKLCLKNTAIVLLQNGLGFEKEIADIMPDVPLYSGACWIKVTNIAPFSLRHEFGHSARLGRYSYKNSEMAIEPKDIRIKALLEEAGLEINLVTNIKSVQLTKLALNIPFYILAAIEGKSFPEILSDRNLDKQRNQLQKEIILAASAINSPVDVDFIEDMVYKLRKIPVVPPDSRIQFAKSMKLELPLNVDPLLDMMLKHDITLTMLDDYRNLICSV